MTDYYQTDEYLQSRIDYFITKSTKIHNNKYDYSIITIEEWERRKWHIDIICPIHGRITARKDSHKNGGGCIECKHTAAGITTVAYYKSETAIQKCIDYFITKSTKIHNNKYDYSIITLEEWKKRKWHIDIICPIHGRITARKDTHKNGCGCFQCARLALNNNKVSKSETAWLNTFDDANIERQKYILMSTGKYIIPDGVDIKNKIIYEFWGDYWHGNLLTYDKDATHPQSNKTFGELNKITEAKRQLILNDGWSLIEIWERDYKRIPTDI